MPSELTEMVCEEKVFGRATDIHNDISKALQQAKRLAGRHGFVADMPWFIRKRIVQEFNHPIWNWYTTMSEESSGMDKFGNEMYVIANLCGILDSPKRITKAKKDGILSFGYGRFSKDEWEALISGKRGEVVMLDELKKGQILPEKYVIVGQRIKMNFHESGMSTIDELRNDDIFLMRCGSEQLRHGFLDKILQKYKSYENRHRVNDVNYSINQGIITHLLLRGNHR